VEQLAELYSWNPFFFMIYVGLCNIAWLLPREELPSRLYPCGQPPQESNVPVVQSNILPDRVGAFTMRLIKPWWFNFSSGQYIHIQVSSF
jgi:hypothetical protein